MNKKLVIFDFDGTLADTFSLGIEIMNQVLKNHKLPELSITDVERFRGMPAKTIKNELNISSLKLIILLLKVQRELFKRVGEVELFAEVIATVKKLKQEGYTLGVITSNSKANVKSVLARYGILQEFDFVYSNRLIFTKHLTIKKAVKKQKIKKSHVVYIGDEVRDIKACRKVKVKFITVDWGYNNASVLEKNGKGRLVGSFEDLYKKIEESI